MPKFAEGKATRLLPACRRQAGRSEGEAISNLPVPTCLRADAQAEHGRQVARTEIASVVPPSQ
ncbi:MAG: hypothetical protein V1781_06635 [Bacteroidota bacterium]